MVPDMWQLDAERKFFKFRCAFGALLAAWFQFRRFVGPQKGPLSATQTTVQKSSQCPAQFRFAVEFHASKRATRPRCVTGNRQILGGNFQRGRRRFCSLWKFVRICWKIVCQKSILNSMLYPYLVRICLEYSGLRNVQVSPRRGSRTTRWQVTTAKASWQPWWCRCVSTAVNRVDWWYFGGILVVMLSMLNEFTWSPERHAVPGRAPRPGDFWWWGGS